MVTVGGVNKARICATPWLLRLEEAMVLQNALDDVIKVHMRYIELDDPDMKAGAEMLLSGQTKMLSIKSPYGTGKSTFLDEFMGRLPESARILVVTHEQSQAKEHLKMFKHHGFVSYTSKERLHVDAADHSLPRVICPVESLPNGHTWADLKRLPKYDLVILVDIESVLRHFVLATAGGGEMELNNLLVMMKDASIGVISVDAMWGGRRTDPRHIETLAHLEQADRERHTHGVAHASCRWRRGWCERHKRLVDAHQTGRRRRQEGDGCIDVHRDGASREAHAEFMFIKVIRWRRRCDLHVDDRCWQ